MPFWKIEPYNNHDADYCVMPANTETDHRSALEYAQARIEAGWDQIKEGQKTTVTIELCTGELPDNCFDPEA